MTVDYHNFCSKDTDFKTRRQMNVGDIWVNAAKCLKCGDVIRSKNQHDFVTCKCGLISVDGGSWFAKRVFKTNEYENIIEPFDDIGPIEQVKV